MPQQPCCFGRAELRASPRSSRRMSFFRPFFLPSCFQPWSLQPYASSGAWTRFSLKVPMRPGGDQVPGADIVTDPNRGRIGFAPCEEVRTDGPGRLPGRMNVSTYRISSSSIDPFMIRLVEPKCCGAQRVREMGHAKRCHGHPSQVMQNGIRTRTPRLLFLLCLQQLLRRSLYNTIFTSIEGPLTAQRAQSLPRLNLRS